MHVAPAHAQLVRAVMERVPQVQHTTHNQPLSSCRLGSYMEKVLTRRAEVAELHDRLHEVSQCSLQVLQPWDDSKFNFTKALQKEVLFQFEASDMPSKGSSFVPLAPVSGEGQALNAGLACVLSCVHVHVSGEEQASTHYCDCMNHLHVHPHRRARLSALHAAALPPSS